MKITNLKLIEKNGNSVIFEVSYKSFFGEKKRLAFSTDIRYGIFYWMDNNESISIRLSIEAWLNTGKEELKIY
jgi:hypothetical protein